MVRTTGPINCGAHLPMCDYWITESDTYDECAEAAARVYRDAAEAKVQRLIARMAELEEIPDDPFGDGGPEPDPYDIPRGEYHDSPDPDTVVDMRETTDD